MSVKTQEMMARREVVKPRRVAGSYFMDICRVFVVWRRFVFGRGREVEGGGLRWVWAVSSVVCSRDQHPGEKSVES